jgi:lipoprotein NlpD
LSLRESLILPDNTPMPRAVVLIALFASACAAAQQAPISYGGAGGSAASPQQRPRAPVIYSGGQPTQAEPGAPAPEPVAVQQTPVPDWQDGEGRSLADYALQPEDAQPFDPARLPRTHRVSGEESLYDIASRYQVPLRALIDENNLEPPYALAPGRELQLPPPRFHTVARDESLEDIAQRYNVDTRSLALLNRMQTPYRVRAGQRVVLPAMARDMGAPAFGRLEESPQDGGAPANARFAWPLRGEIVARFGAQPGGVRLDGVEIAGREGAQIGAAADGDVVYVGSDLDAYGTLVLVRHADNYVTAYAYARRALVREGERVRAGQALAELGSRPDGRARLLFQVRQGANAVDPTPLLGVGD